jgi:peptidyl-prolyl cis-trans isomerase A (cyclophilin A)
MVAGCAGTSDVQRGDDRMGPKMVQLETTMGVILIALEEDAAPATVKNFVRYVEEGFYDETIFHRVIQGFMIQGGGFDGDMKKKQTHPPIGNEFKLSNVRGTVAMAKLGGNPDSATSQFFISLADNSGNLDAQNGGFTVFGRVIEGMDVVDAIAAVRTTTKTATMDGHRLPMRDVPVEPVVIKSAKVVSGG